VRPYIFVEQVDATLGKVVVRDGEVVTAPYPEGDLWVATFRDPAGNVIGVWQTGPRERSVAVRSVRRGDPRRRTRANMGPQAGTPFVRPSPALPRLRQSPDLSCGSVRPQPVTHRHSRHRRRQGRNRPGRRLVPGPCSRGRSLRRPRSRSRQTTDRDRHPHTMGDNCLLRHRHLRFQRRFRPHIQRLPWLGGPARMLHIA
jgi:hypothetical protein